MREKLAKQRKQNLLESDQAFATVLAREAAEKAASKQAEEEQTEEQPEEKTVPQIFAKSAQVPAGTCETGTQCESLSSLGQYGAYAAAIAQGSDELMLSRVAGQALAELPGMAMKIIGRAGILAAFAPTQMGDGTLYSEDDIRQRDMVETNIRLRVDESGHLYGYHVDGDAIPRRTVTQNGDKFEVTLEEGLTIEWIPITGDFGGQPILVNPVPDLETHDIWIHPQAGQGRESDNTYITPIAESELSDYILVFPAETGLKPLYVVYQQLRQPNGQFGPGTESKPSLDRPGLRAKTKRDIQAQAEDRGLKDEDGNFTDEQGNVLSDWHYGHKFGHENRRILKAADELEMSQAELNDFINGHPEYFQIQDAKRNLSHKDEKPGTDDLDDIIDQMIKFLEKRQ
ncbi:S-type Pyocin [Vibrio aerogenes CECT 7868]|uniref:S-type Pyocin n=1 Tax=Vibrio aerogenes CECT 7868 TaxID=1216006 RepID=A0A1M5X205_9VIBR|nr:S-type pyocin domain-containing protein [Vibrio aerogenes]SHH93915.1 S-type Pyocin [Vibrio aerogenes CECT 7868]